jgi:hypothetical protein
MLMLAALTKLEREAVLGHCHVDPEAHSEMEQLRRTSELAQQKKRKEEKKGQSNTRVRNLYFCCLHHSF